MKDLLALAIGIVFAGLGGELFVRGSVGLARWLRVSTSVVALTVMAFATSSPELSVAITSATSGSPQIALGNALGSNILNVALILGIALTLGGLRASRKEIKHNLSVALLVPMLIGLLSSDRNLSRTDGLILLAVFLMWVTFVTIEARKLRVSSDTLPENGRRPWLVVVSSVAGLALLAAAGRLMVQGATGIAAKLGLSGFVIGTVMVAAGTTVPELATTVISRIRGHEEVGLNTILGSNIFNGLFIVAVAAIIYPISVTPRELLPAILFGILTVVLIVPTAKGIIDRWRGFALLVLYISYVLWVL